MIQLNIDCGSSSLGHSHFGGAMNGYIVAEFKNTGTPQGPDNVTNGYNNMHPIAQISEMPKRAVLNILEFIPHSKLVEYKQISKYFNKLIDNDFDLFYGYTLSLNCGRKASFLHRAGTGHMQKQKFGPRMIKDRTRKGTFLGDNNGNEKARKDLKTSKTDRLRPSKPILMREIIINDNKKFIEITSTNRPLKSINVKNALTALSKTKINKLNFKRLLFQPSNDVANLNGNNNNSNSNSNSNSNGNDNGNDGNESSSSDCGNSMNGTQLFEPNNNFSSESRGSLTLPVVTEETSEQARESLKSKISSLKVNIKNNNDNNDNNDSNDNRDNDSNNNNNNNEKVKNNRKKFKKSSKNKLFVTMTPPGNGKQDNSNNSGGSDGSDDSDSNENVFSHLSIASPLVRRAQRSERSQNGKNKNGGNSNNNNNNNNVSKQLASSPSLIKLTNNNSNKSYKDAKRISLSSGNGNHNKNSWNWAAPRDSAFEDIIHILMRAPFTHIIIGEECGSWSWQTLMYIFEHFNKMIHLNINVCGFESTLPNIESESEYQVFVNTTSHFIKKLQTLSCNDDALLRAISCLTKSNHEKCKRKEKREKKMLNDDNKKRHKIMGGLQFIRYSSHLTPTMTITGIEFEGIKVMEIVPWDGMFLNIPKSVYSLRISNNQTFSESSDDWSIVIPNNNKIREICVWSIDNWQQINGISYLNKLESIVIKTDNDMDGRFNKIEKLVKKLAYYCPIKFVSCLWNKEREWKEHIKYENSKKFFNESSNLSDIANNNKVLNMKHSMPQREKAKKRGKNKIESPHLPKYIDVRLIKEQREKDLKQGYETLCQTGLTPNYHSYYTNNYTNEMKFSDLYQFHSNNNNKNNNNNNKLCRNENDNHPKIVSICDGYTTLKKLTKMNLSDSDFQPILI